MKIFSFQFFFPKIFEIFSQKKANFVTFCHNSAMHARVNLPSVELVRQIVGEEEDEERGKATEHCEISHCQALALKELINYQYSISFYCKHRICSK